MIRGESATLKLMYGAVQPFLEDKISGTTYYPRTRPQDSGKEDAVLYYNGSSMEQQQRGRARIAVFVADIDNNTGRKVPDVPRLDEIESLADSLLSLLNDADTDYLWELDSAPFRIPEQQTHETALNFNFRFRIINY